MTRRRGVLLGAAAVVAFAVVAINVAGTMRQQPPEQIALKYGRALYASDAAALWRLISEEDHRVKNEATFQRQHQDLRGFARETVRLLASYIEASPVQAFITGDRASITLRFRLPDANAAEVRALMHEWDTDQLEALAPAERERIRARLVALHRERKLPTIEGDDTIDLVREAGAWRVSLHWANGVRVQFRAEVEPGMPVEALVAPAQASLSPGERLRVTVRATNRGQREVTTRVAHRIHPEAQSRYLALLLCPLFVPVTLAAGETREFTSEYLLLGDAPRDLRALEVIYVFPRGDRN